MPGFVKTAADERIWEKAKKAAKKRKIKGKSFWAYSNAVFHRMKGESVIPGPDIEEGYMTDFKTWWDKHPDKLLTRIPKTKYDTHMLKKKPGDKKGSPVTVWGAPSNYNYVAN
jgi:hypothetical protein